MVLREFGSIEDGVVTTATLRCKNYPGFSVPAAPHSVTFSSRSLPVLVCFAFPFLALHWLIQHLPD